MNRNVICVGNRQDLKYGQEYLMHYNSSLNDMVIYIFLLDGNPLGYFLSELFMTLDEWREKQINEILNEESNLCSGI